MTQFELDRYLPASSGGESVTTRATTAGGQLARLGFADPSRAEALLADRALTGFADPLDDVFHDGLPDALSAAADPDQALLGLVRLMESLRDRGARARARNLPENGRRPRPRRCGAALLVALRRPGRRDRLIAVLGGSIALVDHLVGIPTTGAAWPTPTRPTAAGSGRAWSPRSAPEERGSGPAYDALRIAYRRELLGIAALDLARRTPWLHADGAAELLPTSPRRRWRPGWPSPGRSTARAPRRAGSP